MTNPRTTTSARTKPATVYLVGAGPGDPGLLTLRGAACLGRADLILYDYLVNPGMLEHASPEAELVGLGHHSTGRALSPDEIVAMMLEGAREGRTVVRLKGGDSSVFGRGADEVEPLREAGVPFEIIPGITAGLAAAAYCEIPVTHHDDASAVALIAGRERHTKTQSGLDYDALARFPGTLIFYMGVRRAGQWSNALIENGKPAETPVAIVRWCTRTQQQTVRCTLADVVETIERNRVRPPSLFVVGKVVARTPDLSWFAARPLSGTRVLAAGSPATSGRIRDQLTELGAEVLVQPAIEITDPADWTPVDAALGRLEEYDWVVFSSGNGVDYFMQRLIGQCGDVRRLAQVKVAVIGSATAERLARFHVRADLVPEQFNAESLTRALAERAAGKRFLLAQANRGRTVLADGLKAAGAEVETAVVYDSVDVESPDPHVAMALSSGEVDWITVTSPAMARSLSRLYGDALRTARFASISPLTSATLRELGHEPAAEASPHTTAGLVEAIFAAED